MDLYHGELIRSWGRPNWIEITYVCRYWRLAALNLRELWSSITPELSIAWSQAMIERSSPLPMSIIILVNDGRIPLNPYGLSSLAASELLPTSRIRTLGFLGHHTDVLNLLNRLGRPSLIESFFLRLINVEDLAVYLPESLYGGDAPHLRCLKFESDAYIRMPLSLLANITHFTIDVGISLYRLVETLEAMPQLEVLCIIIGFNNLDSTVIDEDIPLLQLPRLSLLSIRDRTPNSFFILSSLIDGPPTLRRHFFWQDELDMLTQVSWPPNTLLPFIPSESTPGANDGGPKIAQIGGHMSDSFEMRSRTYSGGNSTAASEDALFLFKIEWSSRNPFDFCFPHPALSLPNAPTIEDLTIAQESRLDGAQDGPAFGIHETDVLRSVMRWAELLSNMPSVKTLRLHRGTFACFSVLLVLAATQGSVVWRLQNFSHLQRMIITNSAVHSDARAHPDGVFEAGAGCSMTGRKFTLSNVGPELIEVVNMRSGLEVVLAGCEVEEEMLDELRKRAQVYIGYERVYV